MITHLQLGLSSGPSTSEGLYHAVYDLLGVRGYERNAHSPTRPHSAIFNNPSLSKPSENGNINQLGVPEQPSRLRSGSLPSNSLPPAKALLQDDVSSGILPSRVGTNWLSLDRCNHCKLNFSGLISSKNRALFSDQKKTSFLVPFLNEILVLFSHFILPYYRLFCLSYPHIRFSCRIVYPYIIHFVLL